jgi:hypothetical protein
MRVPADSAKPLVNASERHMTGIEWMFLAWLVALTFFVVAILNVRI